MKSGNKILRYTGVGLGIVAVLLLLLLPGWLKNYAIDNAEELVGRKLHMDKLRINYFTGTIKVYDFKMFEANDSDVFVSFDTLILNTVPYKYLSNTYAFDQLYLQGLDVRIVKKDSTFNFDDLLAFHTTEDSTTTDMNEEEAFKFFLENLELKDASVHFYDAKVDHTSEIEHFSLFIPEIAWDQEHDSDADFEFRIGSAKVEAFSDVHPGSRAFESTIEIDSLQLSDFTEYALEFANIGKLDGMAHASIQLTGNLDNPMETLISGELDLINPLMTDREDAVFLSSEKVLCTLKEINFDKSSYIVEELVFEQPYLKFELDSVSNNLFRIFNYQPDSPETDTEETDALYYALNHVEVNEGRMDYTDNLTGRPFDYALSDIEIKTDSIFSDSQWADVQSTMVLNDRGKLKAEIGFNPLDPMNARIDIAVEDFSLKDLNIYSGYYTGHSILTGEMFYFSSTDIRNGKLNSKNHLLIKNVEVENVKGGKYAIPLKLAVWLLKDRNGDIELDIPLQGDVNDPEVDTWALVGNTLKKKIFNTTENPVISLARFINTDPENLQSMAVQFPDTSLTTGQMSQLDLILQLENEKEGLRTEMNFIGADSLQAKLASMLARQAYNKKTKKDAATDTTGFQAFLNRQLKSDSLDLERAIRQYGIAYGADSLAVNYINTLVSRVDSYLKSRSPETKIKVGRAKVSDKDNIDAAPQFKMKYSLKKEDEDTPTGSPSEPESEDK
ncbi:DUF748 domain-containing protein [Lentiprolixibacter aurantiacus]|uniref:DUF748 domain-containing protein n=1 Tax=Lentiprolixibacter aurantiacus TaxID=2993939 RepID=A0AAE3SMT8_9FLAO|nr:DUF748 domain-containing protein [Lentiprolixibacter aurantiacus]MCX2718651.1 DUF748 domain-containing protein [Lentiprolixibacter aurantiacus]